MALISRPSSQSSKLLCANISEIICGYTYVAKVYTRSNLISNIYLRKLCVY